MDIFIFRKVKRMEKLEYIPGDLVMTNGVSGGTAKDVVYRVVLSDPSRIFVLDDGTVLKGVVRLENLEDAKLEDEGYLYYGSSYVYSKDIIPIPLTPEILEKNGWREEKGDYINDNYHIKLCEKIDGYSAYKVVNDTIVWLRDVKSVSNLQHLLFGLGLNSEMEV